MGREDDDDRGGGGAEFDAYYPTSRTWTACEDTVMTSGPSLVHIHPALCGRCLVAYKTVSMKLRK
jgi:hypothetical protein